MQGIPQVSIFAAVNSLVKLLGDSEGDTIMLYYLMMREAAGHDIAAAVEMLAAGDNDVGEDQADGAAEAAAGGGVGAGVGSRPEWRDLLPDTDDCKIAMRHVLIAKEKELQVRETWRVWDSKNIVQLLHVM